METVELKVGDKVYAEDWCYGEIVRIDGDFADVEFEHGNGGGCLPFKLSDLRREEDERI